jgi:2-polyprenyl-6-methoxyphenol hydroxylase-like FAD-dependent oxidoreductase
MDTHRLKILISGTGIAGAAAALFLHRDGHDVTVIDKAPAFQRLGYGLALKSFGLSVMKDLGLLDALERRAIPVKVIRINEADGSLIKECAADTMAEAAQGAMMAYRSDLHQIVYSAVGERLPIRFGTTIADLTQDDSSVQVTFSTGATEIFDLVIVAEGVRSPTRALLWKAEGYQPFDVIYAAASVERDHWAAPGVLEWYLGPGTSFVIIPVNDTQTLIQAYCRGTFERGASTVHAKELLLECFQSFDAKIVNLIERLNAANYIFYDSVAMVTLPSLSKQRVVLLGDAGYCPTFLSGMGASLGLIGAKALEQSLRGSPSDIPSALARYDTLMQPLVRHFQDNAAEHVHTLLTTSSTRLWIRDWVMRLTPQALLGRSFGKQYDTERALVHEIMGTAA